MDKEIYPFVIRSIRAVDSRQIFQLMDSKNNDVRREKVDSGHFVICDPEKEYAENLTKFICEKEKYRPRSAAMILSGESAAK